MEVDPDFLFIETIKSHPALYHSSHVNYANTFVRNKLWEEITAQFNLKVSAKHKWKDMRDRYVREKKKEKFRTKPRPAAYPPWKCLPKLEWLDDHLRSYTFVTRLPTNKNEPKSKNKKKCNRKTKNESIKIEYEITNDESKDDIIDEIKDDTNDNKIETSFIAKEVEFYEDKIEDDPFKITIQNKCGQIYMENEQLLFVCDFCETVFYESNTFSDHIINFHRTDCINKNHNESILSLECEDRVEFLENSDDYNDDKTNDIDDYDNDFSYNKIDDSYDDTQSSKNMNPNNLNETGSDVKYENNSNQSDSDNETEINIFNLQRPKKIKNENDEYPCPMCEKTYKLYHSLTFHFRNLHANINKCEHCGEIFQSATSLKTHLRKIHRIFKRKIGQEEILHSMEKQIDKNEIPLIPPPIRNDDDRFICLICNNNYSRHESLRKHHINVHLNSKSVVIYRCDLCDKTFQTEYSLKIHQATHSDNRLYKCTKCDADFVHPKFLRTHLRTHLGNRKYPCEYCKETFPKRIDKITHERAKHTKEKPYQCENCLESFTKYSELIVHKNRKHNPNHIKPTFYCEYCKRVFHRKDSYDNHIHKHEGKRPFQCNICMARFISSPILRTHKRIHKKD